MASLLGDFLAGVAGGIPGTVDAVNARELRAQELARREAEIARQRQEKLADLRLQEEMQVERERRARDATIATETRGREAKESGYREGARGLLAGRGLTPEQIAAVEKGDAEAFGDPKAFHAALRTFNEAVTAQRLGPQAKEINQTLRDRYWERKLDDAATPEDRKRLASERAREEAAERGQSMRRIQGDVSFDPYGDDDPEPTPVGEARIGRDRAAADRSRAAAGRDGAEKGAVKDTQRLTALNSDINRLDSSLETAKKRLAEAQEKVRPGRANDRGLLSAATKAGDDVARLEKQLAQAEEQRRGLLDGGQAPAAAAKPKVDAAQALDQARRVLAKRPEMRAEVLRRLKAAGIDAAGL